MFSHAMVNYQNSLLSFTAKASHTLNITAKALSETPIEYDFGILKELAQYHQGEPSAENLDKDQLLYFQDEFKDDTNAEASAVTSSVEKLEKIIDSVENITEDLIGSATLLAENNGDLNSSIATDLAGLNLGNDGFSHLGSYMPSQLLQVDMSIHSSYESILVLLFILGFLRRSISDVRPAKRITSKLRRSVQ